MALPEVKAAYEKSLREGAKILTDLSGLHDTVAAAVKPLAALNPQEGMGFGPGGPQGGGRRGGGPGGPGGMGGTNDLKAFFTQRAASVLAQLDGKEAGVEPQGGFGPGGGGPGGPGGFDPGAMIAGSFFQLTGATEKQSLADFEAGWKKNAATWDKNEDGSLTQAEVTGGVSAALGGAGFGPGMFLGGQIWSAMKSSKSIPVATFASRIALLGKSADADKNGTLTAAELAPALLQALPAPDFGGDFPGVPPPGDFGPGGGV